jgi:hypothetical protein
MVFDPNPLSSGNICRVDLEIYIGLARLIVEFQATILRSPMHDLEIPSDHPELPCEPTRANSKNYQEGNQKSLNGLSHDNAKNTPRLPER